MKKNTLTLLLLLTLSLLLLVPSVEAGTAQTWCKGLAFGNACFNGSLGFNVLTGLKLNWSDLMNIPENYTSWDYKLNATDQRYNDSALALSANNTANKANATANQANATANSATNSITGIQSNITNINSSLTTQTSRINTLNSSLITQTGRIDGLNSSLITQTGRIDNLNASLITQTGRINGLNSSLITQTGRIDTLNSTLITQTGRIDNLNSTKLNVTDQRYNETAMINAVNTSANIHSFGFNTTTELRNVFYNVSNPAGYLNSTTIQGINYSSTISGIQSNLTSVNMSLNLTTNRLNDINSTKLNSSDQRYNDTGMIVAVNNSALKNTGNQVLNGQLTINGNLTIIGSTLNATVTQTSMNGSFTPALNNTFSIGSITQWWSNVYANTLNGVLNASWITNSYWLNITDQRYNDTVLIQQVNTSANIKSLGFNTTAELNNIYYNKSNPVGYINSSGAQAFNESALALNANSTANQANTTANSANATANIAISNITTLFSANVTTNGRIDNLNSTKLNSDDQRYNDSAINTTANIISLGFNTTAQNNNLYYNISNPQGYVNDSGLQNFNETAIVVIANNTANQANATANGKASPGVCSAGTVVQNTTTGGVQCVSASAGSVTQVNTGTGLTGGPITSTGTIAINDTYIQQFNDSAINTTANIVSLGFNTTPTLKSYFDGIYVQLNNLVSYVGNWSADKINYNTTTELSNIFYNKSNPAGYINSSGAQDFNESALALNANSTANTAIINISTLFSANVTTNNRINNINVTKMNINGTNSNITYLQFDNTSSIVSFPLGMMGWDSGANAISVGYPYGATYQMGEELYKEITNLDTVTIYPGMAVSLVGASGNREAGVRTNASLPSSATAFIGIATTTILPNQKGLIALHGDVHELNTDAWTEGRPLYVDPAIPGNLTQNYPSAPNYAITVGIVTVKNANVGVIAVTPGIALRLSDLSDVDGAPLDSDGLILVWNNATKVWNATVNINNYLLNADQRYNETGFVVIANNTANFANATSNTNAALITGIQNNLTSINNTLNGRIDSVNATTTTHTTNITTLFATNVSLNNRIDAINTTANILQLYAQTQRDPQGFPDTINTVANTKSALNFIDSTRNFTISPVGGSYIYYLAGKVVNVSTVKNFTIGNTTGTHIIYFTPSGNLEETAVLEENILCDNTIVAIINYDKEQQKALSFEDERHSHYMECLTHLELHETLGTHYESGLALTNVTVAASANINQSAQLGVTAGQISDEDYHHDSSAYLNPAQIRTYYSLGVAGNWSFKQDTFPVCYSGTCGYVGANGRLGANTGLTSFTQCGNSQFMLTHIFANNAVNGTQDVFAITGTTCYTSAALATTGAPNEIATIMSTNAFNAEVLPLYSLLLLTTTSATNIPKAAWAAPSTGGSFIDYRTSKINGVSGVTQSGTVTLVDTGVGLTGGPITGTGIISIDETYLQQYNQSALALSANNTANVANATANSQTTLISGIQSNLSNVNVTATLANTTANSANATANAHTTLISGIQTNVSNINVTATLANNTANTHTTNITTLFSANLTTNGRIDGVNSTAVSAKNTAEIANSTANSANATANSHTTLISGIQSNLTTINLSLNTTNTLATYANGTANSANATANTAISNITTLFSANVTTNNRIDNLNSTKLNISDQRYNDSAINTTANIISLGFNTTTQNYAYYYNISNPAGYVTSSNLSGYVHILGETAVVGLNTNYSIAQLDVKGGLSNATTGNGQTINFDTFISSPWFNVGYYQNFLKQTEVLGTTWVNQSINLSSNTEFSPIGGLTADRIRPVGTYGNNSQTVVDTSLGNWTFSIYLKSPNATCLVNLSIDRDDGDGVTSTFNLDSSWKRYATTTEFVDAHTNKTVVIEVNDCSVDAWGAQLEPVAMARPYSGLGAATAVTTAINTAHINTNLNVTGTLVSGAMTSTGGIAVGGAISGATTIANSGTQTSTVASGLNSMNVYGHILATTAATSNIPVQGAPVITFRTSLWNGSATLQEYTLGTTGKNNTETNFILFNKDNRGTNRTILNVTALLTGGPVNISWNGNTYFNGSVNINNSNSNILSNIIGDIDGYSELNLKNVNNGTNASGDLVITSNNGDASNYYVDLGINSANYSAPEYNMSGKNDAYLYSQNASLAIATATPGKNITFNVGGTTTSEKVLTLNSENATFEHNIFVGLVNGINISTIDSSALALQANNTANYANTTANFAMPKSGGIFTGAVTFNDSGVVINENSSTFGAGITISRNNVKSWAINDSFLGAAGGELVINNQSGAAVLTILQNGNVGVGITNPVDKLSVFMQDNNSDMSSQVNADGNYRPSYRFWRRNSTGGTTPSNSRMGLISFNGMGVSGATQFTSAYIDSYITGAPTSDSLAVGDFRFYTSNGTTSAAERLRIMGSGYVGIGKIPNSTLDVNGTINSIAVNATNVTAGNMNITNNMTIGTTIGQMLFGNGGGISWNGTDTCLVSPANSTNSRQVLCVTKPLG